MELILYQTQDNENVINKKLTEVTRFNITMKQDIDIVEPILLLNDKGIYRFNECNYCYIEEFKRYYFIRSVESVTKTVWKLYLDCDVLESFKTDILNSQGSYKRNIKDGDFQQINTIDDIRKEIDIYKSNVITDNVRTLVLSTIGGV